MKHSNFRRRTVLALVVALIVTTSGITYGMPQDKSLYDRLTKLELDLTEAIKSERYEDAARTRDEINQVKHAVGQKPAR